jgi:hypothetical protein
LEGARTQGAIDRGRSARGGELVALDIVNARHRDHHSFIRHLDELLPPEIPQGELCLVDGAPEEIGDDHEHLGLRALQADPFSENDAVHPRHDEIGQQQVDRPGMVLGGVQCRRGVFSSQDRIAVLFEHLGGDGAHFSKPRSGHTRVDQQWRTTASCF